MISIKLAVGFSMLLNVLPLMQAGPRRREHAIESPSALTSARLMARQAEASSIIECLDLCLTGASQVLDGLSLHVQWRKTLVVLPLPACKAWKWKILLDPFAAQEGRSIQSINSSSSSFARVGLLLGCTPEPALVDLLQAQSLAFVA